MKPGPVRSAARWARGLLTRLTQPLRRARARSRLRRADRPDTILILCLGNICRSPYADRALRRLLDQRGRNGIRVRSAGFIGPDRPPPPVARDVAARRGIDVSSHRSRLMDGDLAREAGLILVMEGRHARAARSRFGADPGRIVLLGDLDPGSPDRRVIPDPYDGSVDDFERCFSRIDRCLGELVAALDEA